MFDLILAVLFSAMIPLLLKNAHKKNLVDEVILSSNYLFALGLSLLATILKKSQYTTLVEKPSMLTILVVIGILTGITYYLAFYFYQRSVKENGVSLSIAIGKMGIVLPMILSLVIWRELPTLIQWIGIIISMIAIGIININATTFKNAHLNQSLLLFFIFGGLGDFFNKLFEMSVGADYKDLFLAVVFGAALIASLGRVLHHRNVTLSSVLYGFMLGIPNMLTAYFLINALKVMKAAVVYPLYSGGAIIISIIGSFIIFKETLRKKEVLGVILVLLALLLINL